MSYCDLPWFPLWVEDWRTSRKLKAVPRHCRSMYLDVLIELWVDGPITDDEETFRSLLGEDPKTFSRAWPLLRGLLTPIGGGLLTDDKLEEVRADQLAKAEKQRKRAKDRWEKHRAKQAAEAAAGAAGDTAGVPRHSPGTAKREEEKISDQERESAGARAHNGRDPAMDEALSAELKRRTGVLMPDATSFNRSSELLSEYAALTGLSPPEVCSKALEALQRISRKWSSPQAVTTYRLVQKWDDVQAAMAGTIPVAETPPAMARNGRVEQRAPKLKGMEDFDEDLERERRELDEIRRAQSGER